VRHGIVSEAEDYEFCSYSWFRDMVEPGFVERVLSQQLEGYRLKEVREDLET
jgi:hypothetical protein